MSEELKKGLEIPTDPAEQAKYTAAYDAAIAAGFDDTTFETRSGYLNQGNLMQADIPEGYEVIYRWTSYSDNLQDMEAGDKDISDETVLIGKKKAISQKEAA